MNSINVYIHSNGEVESYTEDGIKIERLSGKLPILHKLSRLISASERRAWYEEVYDIPRTPSIQFYIKIIGKNGQEELLHGLVITQIQELIKYIKKK